jgi:hypothetical protein
MHLPTPDLRITATRPTQLPGDLCVLEPVLSLLRLGGQTPSKRSGVGESRPWPDRARLPVWRCRRDLQRGEFQFDLRRGHKRGGNLPGRSQPIWRDGYGWQYSASHISNPPGPTRGTDKVLRGGSWNNYDYILRVAYRSYFNPTNHYSDVGFRCAAPPGN